MGAVTLIESFWTVDARCRVGVPHGSARGPLLFYIFNTDLPNRIEDGNFCLRMIPNFSWIAGDGDSLLRSWQLEKELIQSNRLMLKVKPKVWFLH